MRPDFTSSFLISVGPFIVNSVLCLVFCLPAVVPVQTFGIQSPQSLFWMWLGISIGMHAFPSTGDARNLWVQARLAARRLNPLALVSFPLVAAIFVANALRVFWFDALYGFALGFLLPQAILALLVR